MSVQGHRSLKNPSSLDGEGMSVRGHHSLKKLKTRWKGNVSAGPSTHPGSVNYPLSASP